MHKCLSLILPNCIYEELVFSRRCLSGVYTLRITKMCLDVINKYCSALIFSYHFLYVSLSVNLLLFYIAALNLFYQTR